MALMSYVQRRRSGVYEFRKRLPQALAGKAVPEHMRGRFTDFINIGTGKFKGEFVQPLDTKEAAAAKKQAYRTALKLAVVIEDAEAALATPRIKHPARHHHQPARDRRGYLSTPVGR